MPAADASAPALSVLDQLRDMTVIVADTGDIAAIARLKPTDATTNPSLILKAAGMPEYAGLIRAATASADTGAMDRVAVGFGREIAGLIPGRVSIEVDARLSFDTEGTIDKARRIVAMFADEGVPADRLLIKIAATWEGIRAAERLEKEGINCNLTLIFGFAQARACAEAGVFLISPFVGRILDWHRAANPDREYTTADDPGVAFVTSVYRHFKDRGFATVVMGASFRNAGQIRALAGCDRLTVSPALLDELASETANLPCMLEDGGASSAPEPPLTEREFRWLMNADAMATEKLAQGIRAFAADTERLEGILAERIR